MEPFSSFGKAGKILSHPTSPKTVSEILRGAIFSFCGHIAVVEKIERNVRVFVAKENMILRDWFWVSWIYANVS